MAEQVLTDIAALRRSPLAHLTEAISQGAVAGERGVSLREIPFLNMVGLRAEPGSAGAKALEAAAGLPLPAGHGQVSGDADTTAILWLGPDEFLLVGPEGTDATADLAAALGGEPGAVVDLSANRTTLELSGPSARLVLEKGCHADLHPRAFRPGTAITTQLGPVPVLLWQTAERDGGQAYRIMPRASFADYTARWLLDAMTEFASPEVD